VRGRYRRCAGQERAFVSGDDGEHWLLTPHVCVRVTDAPVRSPADRRFGARPDDSAYARVGPGRTAVRATALDDDDVLEPLPVFVDGVAFAPVRASQQSRVVAEPPWADLIETTTTVSATVAAVHELGPWSGSESRAVPSVRLAGSTGGFSRMIGLRAGQ